MDICNNEEGFVQPTLPEKVSIENPALAPAFITAAPGRTSSFGQRRKNVIESHIEVSKLPRGRFTRSGSTFASVGAWRSTVINMDGQQVANDVASSSNIQRQVDFKTESHEFNRVELWIVLCIASIVCLVGLWQILPISGTRTSLERAAVSIPSISIVLSLAGSIASAKRHITEIIMVRLGRIVILFSPCRQNDVEFRNELFHLPSTLSRLRFLLFCGEQV
jgi:hypothetical protein